MEVNPLDTVEARPSRLNAAVAITVALLSTVMGVCKVKDDNIVQAMQQAQADKVDHYAFYQARNLREELARATLAQLRLQAPGPAGRRARRLRRGDRAIREARDRPGAEEVRGAAAGAAGREELRCAELPRRSVAPRRRGVLDRDPRARDRFAHPVLVAVRAGPGSWPLRH